MDFYLKDVNLRQEGTIEPQKQVDVSPISQAVECYFDLTPAEVNVVNSTQTLYLPVQESTLSENTTSGLTEKLDKILSNQNVIMENQKILLEGMASKEVQERIVGQVAKLETMLDTCLINIIKLQM